MSSVGLWVACRRRVYILFARLANVRPLLVPLHRASASSKNCKTEDRLFIIITRPKLAYDRQGLAGSWGQDTDQAGTFRGVLNVSLSAFGAQLRYKLTWNHKKTAWNHEKPTWNLE